MVQKSKPPSAASEPKRRGLKSLKLAANRKGKAKVKR